ncbi:BLUF domain-containing protein, partial [Larkinella insperata]
PGAKQFPAAASLVVMDFCITYFSTAVEATTEADILDIVAFSRTKNARLGITGVLLYVNGSIVQVLEGQQQSVEQLYESIRKDPRHTAVKTVIHQPIAQRLFGHWFMGYETLTTQQYQEVENLLPRPGRSAAEGTPPQPIILEMLQRFFEINHRPLPPKGAPQGSA